VSGVSPARRARLLSAAIVGVGAALVRELAIAGPLFAALFACTEGPGITIITDSPTQLSRCRPMSESSSPTGEERPQRPAPDPIFTLPAPVEPPKLASPPKEHTVRPASISVPLERLGSLFVVTIQINETRLAKLILDTGASHTILSHAIARELGLFSRRPVASVTMHTVGGSVQADMVQVDSIRIGGAEVRNSIVAIHDLPDAPSDVEGLLGLSVLHQFEVTLDTARSRLHLGLPQP
jgi:clan AA aspartic protease (TIGR02281 family)